VNRTYWHSDAIDKPYPVDASTEKRQQVPFGEANLVGSLLDDGHHAPAIDLDLPCKLLPSSTPGHHHLLIDKAMPWWKYVLLLRVLVFVGLVERKFYRHSRKRRQTFLRLPHVRKGIDYRPVAFGPGPNGEEF